MRKEVIEKVCKFMEEEIMKLANYKDNTEGMASYRIEHSYRVGKIGLEIAKKEGLDEERTYVACLLHDIGYSLDYESKEEYINHGRYGAKIAREFLSKFDYTKEQIDEMCYGIAIHVDDKADFVFERTKLALVVGDADNIDRFDAYRLYEGLEFAKYKDFTLEQQREYVNKKLFKLNQFLEIECGSPTAQKMWNDKIEYQIHYFEKLKKQIDNSCVVYE